MSSLKVDEHAQLRGRTTACSPRAAVALTAWYSCQWILEMFKGFYSRVAERRAAKNRAGVEASRGYFSR
jgi:hypothetical protein